MCFIITLAHGHRQLDGGGGGVDARPFPFWKHKITISIWGAFSPSYGDLFFHMKDLFFLLGGIVSPFALFWGLYSLCEGLFFSLYVESFSSMSSLTKIAASAHALAARVLVWRLREI